MDSQDEILPANQSGKWVGYELHDGLLQWLVGSRMNLEAILDRPGVDEKQLRGGLHETLHSLVAAIDEGRSLISYLEEHSNAPKMDLQVAVHGFLNAPPVNYHGRPIQYEFLGTGADLHIPQDIGWNVLRIVQQAVRNAIFHADPANITVQIVVAEAGQCCIRIEDDGRGFDVQAMTARDIGRDHFGLSSMKHRAQLLGGSLEICSAVGQGSTIRLTVPLEQRDG